MPQLKKTMFREYDVRGRVEAGEFDETAIEALARGFAAFLEKRGIRELVLGYDLRSYSARLHDAALAGLLRSGCRVTAIGCVPTPVLYFSQYGLNVRGGMMITASHNPNGWSGLKLCHGFSQTLNAQEIQELYDIILQEQFISGQGSCVYRDVRLDYIEDLVHRVKIPSGRRPKVVLDAGNGTASLYASELYRRAGCDVIAAFCDPDTNFPHHFPNPSDIAGREALRTLVLQHGAMLGLSFDGDGDRLGVVDDNGKDVWSDIVLALLAEDVIARKPGAKIVFDVKCTAALPEHITRLGGTPIMWKTGHSYIKAKCHEEGAALGGERSGHIFFYEGYYGFDDGLFAGLKLVERLAAGTKPLSKIVPEITDYITSPEIHVHCADEHKYRVVDTLVQEFKREYGAARVVDINGARVTIGSGWGLVRASSNMPELVLVFEAKSQDELNSLKEIFRRKLAQFPEVAKKWDNE